MKVGVPVPRVRLEQGGRACDSREEERTGDKGQSVGSLPKGEHGGQPEEPHPDPVRRRQELQKPELRRERDLRDARGEACDREVEQARRRIPHNQEAPWPMLRGWGTGTVTGRT